MTPPSLPITLDPLVPKDWRCRRAGVQWLVPHGGVCVVGQVVAHCVVGFTAPASGEGRVGLLDAEHGSFKLVFVARHAGVIHHEAGSSHGGWHDRLEVMPYESGVVIGRLTPVDGAIDTAGQTACLAQMVAARKVTRLTEDRAGLHSGWHDRRRAWQVRPTPPEQTLLGLGSCDLAGIMEGDANSFTELLGLVPGDVHLVNIPDVSLVPTARIVAQQLGRTQADRDAIWEDFSRGMVQGEQAAQPDDWMFGSVLMKAICAAPAGDEYDVFSPEGIRRLPPADVVMMSLSAETPIRLEHRRLGYDIRIHAYRIPQMPRALQNWLRGNFVQISNNIKDIKADYIALLELLNRRAQQRRLVLLNAGSSLEGEDVQNYQAYDEPHRLTTIWAKELNLMADELARDHPGIHVLDADAVAGELGSGYAAPDGIHHSGEMQQAMREEIARTLGLAVGAG